MIAIDGPSGSGKGTVSKAVAGALGWHLLDSGALYRVTAIAVERAGVGSDDVTAIVRVAEQLPVTFSTDASGEERILLGDDEITRIVRHEETGEKASIIASLQPVRDALLERQRRFRMPPGLVADGRDMGTQVFPDAGLKIFLTASAAERADRRHKQLKRKGIDVNFAALLQDIEQRDRRDVERAAAPLRPADDAILIDSTSMSIDAVVASVIGLKNARFGIGGAERQA